MSRYAGYRKDRREAIGRSRQREAQIERYLHRCEITLNAKRPMNRTELVADLEHHIAAGGAIKLHPFVRHNYTDYDQICQYVARRWQRPIPAFLKHEILHPKVREIVTPWLKDIDALDLVWSSFYGIKANGRPRR